MNYILQSRLIDDLGFMNFSGYYAYITLFGKEENINEFKKKVEEKKKSLTEKVLVTK